jgi:hypothetical protein
LIFYYRDLLHNAINCRLPQMGNLQHSRRRVNVISSPMQAIAELSAVVVDSDSALSSESSRESTPQLRRVTWGGDTTGFISKAATFRKTDEACKIAKDDDPLAAINATAEVRLNAALPASNAEMLDRLSSKYVQIENVVIRFSTVFVFVSSHSDITFLVLFL